MPLELGAETLDSGSGVLAWPVLVTVALFGLVPEYRMPPERSSSGVVIEGEPDDTIDVDEVRVDHDVAVGGGDLRRAREASPEVPEVARTRMAAVE